jgi:hypothetical protein
MTGQDVPFRTVSVASVQLTEPSSIDRLDDTVRFTGAVRGVASGE